MSVKFILFLLYVSSTWTILTWAARLKLRVLNWPCQELFILYFGKNLKWTNFKDAIVTSNCDHGLVQVSLLKMQSAMDALQKVTEETVGPKRKNVRKHNRSASVAYEALAFEWVILLFYAVYTKFVNFFITLHIPYKI